jgi:hypothetical protein
MIDEYTFGHIQIEGQVYTKDVKICQGKIIHPWWRKSGHLVEREDIEDMLNTHPDILVLGKGQPGMMRSSEELRESLKQEGLELIELPTSEAIEHFNLLWEQGKNVCAGFHLTC